MRLNFRQGVVSHQSGGFLNLNHVGNVELQALNRPVMVTVAHQNTNYLYSENNNVDNAWSGPFDSNEKYWLYWDFNPLTFERTFGLTTLEPVVQSVEPGFGNTSIANIIPGDPQINAFVIPEYYLIPDEKSFAVVNSTGNDGTYTVYSSSYDGVSGHTTVVVNEAIPDSTVDGDATFDIDSEGNPLKTDGRIWYDTVNNIHYELFGSVWQEVLRVFACKIINGNTFISHSINSGSGNFSGTQIGNLSSILAGRVLFDESGTPILRDNRTFFTTEDQFFANAARVDAIRLESNVSRAQSIESNAMAEFSIVAFRYDGQVGVAQYSDTTSTVVGVLTENLLYLEVGAVVIQGVVTNPAWDWTSVVPVGSPLWVNNGELLIEDPHVTDVVTYPVGKVPVARVLSVDTVVFEQGLGGKGDTGPPGSVDNFPMATTTSEGAVVLVTPSSDSEIAYAISDTDPRLSDSRTPLAHLHDAPDVSFTPGGGVISNNTQDAIEELGLGKVNKAGDSLTGFLTLHSNPTLNLHAATKNYVDGLVSGVVWLDPICLTNVISDAETVPPSVPTISDAYIIPVGSSGAWSAISAGTVVVWDGAIWIDLGVITDINPTAARFGVSMTSSTIATGSYTGHENEIALFDNTGTLIGFEVPIQNNAVYVCNAVSLNAYNQYVFHETEWLLFGGGQSVTAGINLTQIGNTLNVINHIDGGTIDAAFWQGLEPADLNTVYSAISHTHPLPSHSHNAEDVVFPAYLTSPDWGTPSNVGSDELNGIDVELALKELMDEKASKTPTYATVGDLPTAANIDGMIVHVEDEGLMYFAHSGTWFKLSDETHEHNIPYDMSFFVAGNMLSEAIVGSFLVTRTIFIPSGAAGSIAISEVAIQSGNPSITYAILHNGVSVGTLFFNEFLGTTGTITIPSDITLSSGDKLQLKAPIVIDADLKDISMTLVGCATASACTI